MELPITERGKKYGYLFWEKSFDRAMAKFLGSTEKVRLFFQGSDRGGKNVDWKYRRISIGYKWTRELPAGAKAFKLRREGSELHITCK